MFYQIQRFHWLQEGFLVEGQLPLSQATILNKSGRGWDWGSEGGPQVDKFEQVPIGP